MNIPKERSQLFNVSAAYTKVDVAVGLLDEAYRLLREEQRAGLPVPQVVMDAITESRKARELIWIFLKRMP